MLFSKFDKFLILFFIILVSVIFVSGTVLNSGIVPNNVAFHPLQLVTIGNGSMKSVDADEDGNIDFANKSNLVKCSDGTYKSVNDCVGSVGGILAPSPCEANEVLKRNAANTDWICAADLAGSGALPNSCSNGQVAKYDGVSAWTCEDDLTGGTTPGGTGGDCTKIYSSTVASFSNGQTMWTEIPGINVSETFSGGETSVLFTTYVTVSTSLTADTAFLRLVVDGVQKGISKKTNSLSADGLPGGETIVLAWTGNLSPGDHIISVETKVNTSGTIINSKVTPGVDSSSVLTIIATDDTCGSGASTTLPDCADGKYLQKVVGSWACVDLITNNQINSVPSANFSEVSPRPLIYCNDVNSTSSLKLFDGAYDNAIYCQDNAGYYSTNDKADILVDLDKVIRNGLVYVHTNFRQTLSQSSGGCMSPPFRVSVYSSFDGINYQEIDSVSTASNVFNEAIASGTFVGRYLKISVAGPSDECPNGSGVIYSTHGEAYINEIEIYSFTQ